MAIDESERAWDEKRQLLETQHNNDNKSRSMEGLMEETAGDGYVGLDEKWPWKTTLSSSAFLSRRGRSLDPLRILIIVSLCLVFSVSLTYTSSHFPKWSIPFLSDCRMGSHSSSAAHNGTVGAINYTCNPYQSCWPTTSQWDAFNKSISGNLRVTQPLAEPCYRDSSSPECQAVAANYTSGTSRASRYGDMEFINWESCGQADCSLNSFSPLSTPSGVCALGRLSAYHVQAKGPHEISKTLAFVQQHGIRLSIKNSGHDYFGRSSTANSLALWTQNMKTMTYHKSFRASGCKTQYHNIGEIGAGISAGEASTYFQARGMHVTVGAVPSVGIAGGFGQGGGHGPLGPSYGLMVDQAVEFEVVVADGSTRLINECSDPDLFWAMRGGGGSTYAVLTRYKFQLHPAVPMNVYSFQANFPNASQITDMTKSTLHRDIVTALALNQTQMSANRVAGYNFIYPDHIVSLQILPSTDTQALQKYTAQLHDFLSDYPGLNITENEYFSFANFTDYAAFVQLPSIARNGPVGVGLAESGRLIPRSLFVSPSSISQLVDAFLQSMQISYSRGGGISPGSGQIYATGPANHPDNSKTGINPAWRNSLWEIILGGIWVNSATLSTRSEIQQIISDSMKPLKTLTPGGGCYVNEGDWTEQDWQQTFFGSNYDRLLNVKETYDPTGLFNCWKCVGWNGANDPMYSCYGQSTAGNSPNPSVPLGPV